jgi:hypothetical protein
MSDRRNDPEERIRERAYLLWERAGRPEGRADGFWEEARGDEEARAAREEERLDEEARESFPASDPPPHTGITGERAGGPWGDPGPAAANSPAPDPRPAGSSPPRDRRGVRSSGAGRPPRPGAPGRVAHGRRAGGPGDRSLGVVLLLLALLGLHRANGTVPRGRRVRRGVGLPIRGAAVLVGGWLLLGRGRRGTAAGRAVARPPRASRPRADRPSGKDWVGA